MVDAGTVSHIVVVGRSNMLCETLARWLSEVGNLTARVLEHHRLEAAITADAVILLMERAEDLELLQAVPPSSSGVPPRRLVLFPEWQWQLMEQAAASDVDVIIGPPVSGRLLRGVLDLIGSPGHYPRPLWILSGPVLSGLPAGTGHHPPVLSAPPAPAPLTPRELEILALLDRDFSNQDIARLLVISPHTVKRHLEHLFRKLAVSSSMEAVHIAHRHGLLRTRRTDGALPGRQPELASPN